MSSSDDQGVRYSCSGVETGCSEWDTEDQNATSETKEKVICVICF